MEIDYSLIKEQPSQNVSQNSWKPPRHVFFGKKDPNTGMMEDEPVYQHQNLPAMLYIKENGRIKADIADSKEEYDEKVKLGFVDSPAKIGVVTSPSFEEVSQKSSEVAKKKTAVSL